MAERAAAALLLLLSGCTLERTLLMPDPLPVAAAPQHPHRWSPGTTAVRFTGYPFQRVRWAPARQQLTERLTVNLAASSATPPEQADFLVDTSVTVQEDSAPNAWTVLGIFTGALLVGVGTAAGNFVPRAANQQPGAWPFVGAALAMIPAVIISYVYPSVTWKSVLTAELAVRRANDGATVARTTVQREWQDDFRGIGAAEPIAAASGFAAAELEAELLKTIAVTLARLDSPRLRPAAP